MRLLTGVLQLVTIAITLLVGTAEFVSQVVLGLLSMAIALIAIAPIVGLAILVVVIAMSLI